MHLVVVYLQLQRWGRKLQGTSAGCFYMAAGALYIYWVTDWRVIGRPIEESGLNGSLHDALSAHSVTGAFAMFFGMAIIVSRATRFGKVATLAGLERMKNRGFLSEQQVEMMKSMLFRDTAIGIVMDFLASAERARLSGVGNKAITSLRSYAEELSRQRGA